MTLHKVYKTAFDTTYSVHAPSPAYAPLAPGTISCPDRGQVLLAAAGGTVVVVLGVVLDPLLGVLVGAVLSLVAVQARAWTAEGQRARKVCGSSCVVC